VSTTTAPAPTATATAAPTKKDNAAPTKKNKESAKPVNRQACLKECEKLKKHDGPFTRKLPPLTQPLTQPLYPTATNQNFNSTRE
jgi:hypothetical protein